MVTAIKKFLKKILTPEQIKDIRHMYRKKIPRKHVIITGTGRAGTTFLVQLLTYLGFDTGFTCQNMPVSKYARAGLEHDARKENAPYIVKSPAFCDYAEEILGRKDIRIKHVFIPMRDLYAAAESRRYVQKIAPSNCKKIVGGLWHTNEGNDQERILLHQIYKLTLALSNTAIPVTLLLYPRLVKDKLYLYKKLKPILKRISYRKFCSAFEKICRPDLINNFDQNTTKEQG